MAGVRIRTWLRRLTVVVVVLFILPVIGTGAAGKTSPTAGWQTSTPEEQGIRSDVLADMLERVRWNQYRIDSVSIVRNGYLVLDVYFHSRSKDAMHATYSATKSVMSALIGIAIDKGYIGGVTEPVLSLLPERQIATADARKRSMTLEHLLTMTTGLKCRDSNRYGYVGYMKMRQSADWTQFVLDLPMEADPGKRFEYCNGASFLLSAILAKATKSDVLEFAQTHLFSSLGIKDVFWSRSSRNIRNGCCGLSLTPHDMAKFGWLFLNRGEWNGRRVISSAWVDRAIRRHVDVSPHHYYGYQWWRDARGYYMAIGHKGQRIFVIPSKKMVVVFTGTLERSTALAPEVLLDKFVIPSAKSDSPLSPNVKQQKRLAELIATSAEAHKTDHVSTRRHVWQTPADGIAFHDVFIRHNPPAFQFRYPRGSNRDETLDRAEVMRMRTPSGVVVDARVMVIPQGVTLANVGPVSYAALLGRLGSKVATFSNRPIELNGGADGYRTEFRWQQRFMELRTVIVSAFKGGKWISIATHHPTNISVAAEIVKTLEFADTK